MHIGTYIRQLRLRSEAAGPQQAGSKPLTALGSLPLSPTRAARRGAACRPAAQGCPAAGRWLDTAGSLDTAKYGCIRVQFGYGGYVSAM